ncbi:MAG: hypothetical protein OIF50_11705 [Flavobacteriaceae bacterium]|nr:hypothetical protein [Flavobacteriaceae bacterium]
MRYISVGLFNLAIRTSNNPDYCPLAGPLLTITCMFSIITGGLSVCYEIRRRLLELPPTEPEWLQALLRACDCEFVWDATRGKPRASSSEGMEEGQDQIDVDKSDAIVDEGQGDAQNNDGDLGAYVPRNLVRHIYQAGAASTIYYFLFF